jgi:hypothetical protein
VLDDLLDVGGQRRREVVADRPAAVGDLEECSGRSAAVGSL